MAPALISRLLRLTLLPASLLVSCVAPPPPQGAAQAPVDADCYRPAAPGSPALPRDAVFYEVFVRSFQDSDGDGNGDLDGLRSRLDYLQQLGVSGLWLSSGLRPASGSAQDAGRPGPIDPRYGGDEALRRLGDEARRRGLQLLLADDRPPAVAFEPDLGGALLADLAAGRPDRHPGVLCRPTAGDPGRAPDATSLTGPSQDRALTRLGGGVGLARLAAGLLLTLPGTPFLYYGDELGMRSGGAGGEPGRRTPMQWTAGPGAGFSTGRPWQPLDAFAATINVEAEQTEPSSLLAAHRTLIGLRRSHPALGHGDYRALAARCPGGACSAFLRRAPGELALVVANLGQRAAQGVEVELPAGEGGSSAAVALQDLLPVAPAPGLAAPRFVPGATLRLGAQAALALRILVAPQP